jgi:hypothetical protein
MENSETVEEFIQYREKFNEAVSLLDELYSNFLKTLDKSIELYLKINDTKSVTITVPIPHP